MDLNLSLLMPEWILVGFLVLLILREILWHGSNQKLVPAWIAFLAALASALGVLSLYQNPDAGAAFNGSFIADGFALFFKAFFAVTAMAIIPMAIHFFDRELHRLSEFFLILLSTLIGLFFLVSANDLLLMFVALEIVTLSFYIATAYSKNNLSSIEAGLKYLIIGSLASAFVIFGISLIYASVGSTSFSVIRTLLTSGSPDVLLTTGVLMIISGLGFKMAAFPFQFWVPDVYEGAPTPTVAFLSVGSKAAGFAVLLRILTVFGTLKALGPLLFSILATATLLYGNLGALVQTNIKRLLGYSSIGHAGYLLLAVAVGTPLSKQALLYYLMAYGFSALAAFLVVSIAGSKLSGDLISDYRGLGKRAPFLAGMLFLSFLSLAGVPPLAGFSGKYLILFSAVKEKLLGLALLGSILVAVSLYYYLNVVKVMYFEDSPHEEVISPDGFSKTILILLAAGILIAGIWQMPFFKITADAVRFLN